MSSAIGNLLDFNLTRSGLEALGHPPLIAGDDWILRLQVRDAADQAVSLSGALLLMVWRDTDSGPALLTRRSDVSITTTSIKPLEADAIQNAETGDTGKGWFEMRFRHEEEPALIALAGSHLYDVRIKYASGSAPIQTFMRGRIECVRPRATPVP